MYLQDPISGDTWVLWLWFYWFKMSNGYSCELSSWIPRLQENVSPVSVNVLQNYDYCLEQSSTPKYVNRAWTAGKKDDQHA